ncbi:Verru_Chthon cassette protein D [Verrucomicrobiales bacterium]|jgi:uncharacterized protein (TIGR02596 family)|nr:Verru_Chthon cassette protein D [Verrucomicrobiales bacterium]MDC0259267.1 Verru_Chthon cassette protein D [Verrucomicrobiales bacterium]MDC0276588.1 Verru_Chthon cassette protein D [Verrucomicrobiales bacterium]
MDHQPSKIRRSRGFSIIELMIVITIMGMLVGVTLGGVLPMLHAYRLSSSAGQLQADLAYGSQLSGKLNVPIEFRFYRHDDLNSGRNLKAFRSYQLVKRDGKTGDVIPLNRITHFEIGIVIHELENFSSILDIGEQDAGQQDPTIPLGNQTSDEYSYIEIQYRPDGSTTLPKDKIWCVTLVNENRADEDILPENFRTLVINPVTGSVRKY